MTQKHAQTIVAAIAACTLIWLQLGVPLACAIAVHLALSHLSRSSRSDAPGGDSEASRETVWGGAAAVVLVAVACIHFGLLTRGTGEVLGPEMLSGSFDSLAQSLLEGHAEVAPETIRWEAFVVEGRSYMYFGPWPALLRVPTELIAPQGFGLWARVSCFAASMLSLAGFAWLLLGCLERNRSLHTQEKRFLLLASLVGLGLGSPLLFLMNAASIYHESILWGFAGFMLFAAVVVPRVHQREQLITKLPLLSVIAGATFLSRVTYGAPLLVILLLIAGHAVAKQTSRPSVEPRTARVVYVFASLLPAGVMLLFHVWYNFDRFGSPFTFVDYRLMGFMNSDPRTLAILDETGVFNLTRLLTALENYFVPSAGMLGGNFPWFRISPPHYPDVGLYPRIFNSQVLPLSAMSSWLVVGGLVGVGYTIKGAERGFAQLCLLAFATQAVLISSYYIMELRYEVDLVPMFVFGYGMFLAEVSTRRPLKGRAQDLTTVVLFMVALSVIVAISGTLSAIALGGPAHPQSYKNAWFEHFRSIDALMPGR